MKKYILTLLWFTGFSFATVCPSPNELYVLPMPWQDSPFTDRPRDFSNIQWIRAQILYRHAGVICSYRLSSGETYSIWWNTPFVKGTYAVWQDDERSSYVCTEGIEYCAFEDFYSGN